MELISIIVIVIASLGIVIIISHPWETA